MAKKLEITATKLTFVLGLLCLAIVGYCAVVYIHLSFSHATEDAGLVVIRQRTALSALAMATSISCIIMGFAAFMIGAKGEVRLEGESTGLKGVLIAGVPGPAFVVCGTVIAVAVLTNKITHEELKPAAQPSHSAPPNAASSGSPASPNSSQVLVNRTIASLPELQALYLDNPVAYQALLDLRTKPVTSQRTDLFVKTLMTTTGFAPVTVEWDDRSNLPRSARAQDQSNADKTYDIKAGYLIAAPPGNDFVRAMKALLVIRMYGGGGKEGIERVDWAKALSALKRDLTSCYFIEKGAPIPG